MTLTVTLTVTETLTCSTVFDPSTVFERLYKSVCYEASRSALAAQSDSGFVLPRW